MSVFASDSAAAVPDTSRRQFLQQAVVTAAIGFAAPAVITAAKSDSRTILGTGDYQYEVTHDFLQLPSQYHWQTTHNAAVDAAGNLYVIHEGRVDLPDHPSIFVFDRDGAFVRAFGQQFQGGGHGIEVRQEGGTEFLYVAAYQEKKTFAKLDLRGEVVWQKYAPMESGVYAAGEDQNFVKGFARDRFQPTNFAFLDDGGFLLADGYGAYYIHRFDQHANWVSSFGGPGPGEGTFQTAHGLWIDRRGAQPRVVVTDRARHTLQTFTLEGQYLQTLTGFRLPANIDIQGDLMLVPELGSRLSILGPHDEVLATLGDDNERVTAQKKPKLREAPDLWQVGKFVHPHDACFGAHGEIYVVEWVATGRVSRLTRRT